MLIIKLLCRFMLENLLRPIQVWSGKHEQITDETLTTVIFKPGRFHVEGWTDIEDMGVPTLDQVREAELGATKMSTWTPYNLITCLHNRLTPRMFLSC